MTPAAPFIRFAKDEEGTAAVLWAISLVAVLGLATIGFEVGKMGRTQAELQAFVDSVALAAAAELDGRSDSIERAESVIEDLVDDLLNDRNTFGVGADSNRILDSADVFDPVFLKSLPANDTDPITDTHTTTTPSEASLVLITARPHSVRMTLLRVLNRVLGRPLGNDPEISASAVAGWAQAACDVTPLMFCLPSHDIKLGDMIELRAKGGSGTWSSGNFGFLQIYADSNGICSEQQGSEDACTLSAQEGIGQCVFTNGTVTIDTGMQAGPAKAINNRFDEYDNVTKHFDTDPNFAPAMNVVKGKRISNGNGCNAGLEDNTYTYEDPETGEDVTVPITMALPRDTCLGDPNSCSRSNDARFGDGVWDKATYLATNHPNVTGFDLISPAAPIPTGLENSRYAVYLREITIGNTPTVGGNILNPTATNDSGQPLGETGIPGQCRSTPSPSVHRRTLVVAGIKCGENDPINQSKSDIPVDEYYEVFLTEPVEESSQFGIFGEVIGVPTNAGNGNAGPVGIFRDVVQLYR